MSERFKFWWWALFESTGLPDAMIVGCALINTIFEAVHTNYAAAAFPASRHMTRTHHTGTVPGAAGGYAQSLQPFMIETMHPDPLQFVHDNLINAAVAVAAREKHRAAMARIAEWLERHHERCMASLMAKLFCATHKLSRYIVMDKTTVNA